MSAPFRQTARQVAVSFSAVIYSIVTAFSNIFKVYMFFNIMSRRKPPSLRTLLPSLRGAKQRGNPDVFPVFFWIASLRSQ
jgi:hypothetical protein